MSTSADFDFKDVLAVALGYDRPVGITEIEEQIIKDRLNRKLVSCRIAGLTLGPDPEGVQTSQQHDSLNHTVIYVELVGDSMARFSMENAEDCKKGTEARGELVMKLQEYTTSSWKEVACLSRPWVSEWIPTLRHLVIFTNIASVDQFIMSRELVGCRLFSKGFAKILIEGLCFDLNMSHEEFGWDTIRTRGKLNPQQLAEELARLSIPRLEEFFHYYYTSHGKKRVMGPPDGRFVNELRHGRKIMEDYLAQLRYLLPQEVPGAANEE